MLSNDGNQLAVVSLIVLTVFISVGSGNSCSSKKSFVASNVNEQLNTKPRDTPLPIQWTKENQGKRCEARNYFGLRTKETFGDGYSPYCYKLDSRLIKAAREGNLEEIRETLRYGASPILPVGDFFPPLLMAASSGQTEAVRLLLDNGAEVNHVSDFQNTALYFAASEGHVETTRLLLERGADPCYPEKGRTAGDSARARGFKEVADLLKIAEVQKCK